MTARWPAWRAKVSLMLRTWCTPWRLEDLDTYYLGRLAAPNTIHTVPEKTLLAFADHGSLDDRLEPDYAAAERAIAAGADAGIDADALAEHLQRHGAGHRPRTGPRCSRRSKKKAAKLTQHARGKIDEGPS